MQNFSFVFDYINANNTIPALVLYSAFVGDTKTSSVLVAKEDGILRWPVASISIIISINT